jgi:hypothetical protein
MNLQMRLGDFVGRALQDPVFRRLLRYEPRRALAEHGLSGALAPASLPVKHYEVQVELTPELLFGLPLQRRTAAPGLDLRLVAYGVRPMALVHGPEAVVTDLGDWARARGMFALLSPRQFVYQTDVGKPGYANYTVPEPAVPGSGAWRGVLVSPDVHHVLLGWLSLLFRWDDFLGRLLGYPECCVKAFAERWPVAAREHQGDLAPMILDSVGPHDWRLNLLGRYFGVELLPHFPCSLACEASRRQAEGQVQMLGLVEPERAAELRAALAAPYLFTETEGVFAFPGATWADEALSYTPETVRGTVRSGPVAEALAGGAALRVEGGQVSLGGAKIAARLAVFGEGA